MQSVQLSLLLAASACLQLASAVPVLNAPSCPEAYGVQTYAHPEACDHFFLCTNGTLTLEQCENGLLYDGQGSVHNHCNYHWAVECGPRKALLEPINAPGCEFKYGIYPESAACSTNYIKCADAVPYQTPCDPGLAYDAKTHKCNWPDELLDTCNPEGRLRDRVRIYGNPTITYRSGSIYENSTKASVNLFENIDTCNPEVEADSSPGCEFKFGIYADSDSCSTSYIKCEHGYPYQTPCEPGLAYDEKSHKCNWPDELQHICNPEAVVGFKCPEKLDPHSPSAKFWPFPRFPVPNDCERLITCVKGFPRLITCGDNKVFDENTLTCEEPENVPRCAHFKRK